MFSEYIHFVINNIGFYGNDICSSSRATDSLTIENELLHKETFIINTLNISNRVEFSVTVRSEKKDESQVAKGDKGSEAKDVLCSL